MTEQELRRRVVDAMYSWKGATKGSAKHLDILATYNAYTPLARGYAVQPKDDYCATTVSAAFIKAEIAPYTGTECSCGEFIKIARNRGLWVEDDAHEPKIGDALIYAWGDDGKGDNVSGHDHIGIVASVRGNDLLIIEGNMSGGRVGTRPMKVDGRYIRGYICPDYKAIAAALSASEWARAAAYWAVHNGLLQGNEQGDMLWQQPITREQWAVLEYRLAKSGGKA